MFVNPPLSCTRQPGVASQLFDGVSCDEITHTIRILIESLDDTRVVDLHLWGGGTGHLGCIVSVMASAPHSVAQYREAVLAVAPIEHLLVEVERCPHHEAA